MLVFSLTFRRQHTSFRWIALRVGLSTRVPRAGAGSGRLAAAVQDEAGPAGIWLNAATGLRFVAGDLRPVAESAEIYG